MEAGVGQSQLLWLTLMAMPWAARAHALSSWEVRFYYQVDDS